MGLPLTVYPGTYTPGAETALHAAIDVINESWAQANIKTTAFEAKIDAATTGFLDVTTAPHVTAGSATGASVVEPVVDIPATQSAGDVMALFTTEYEELIAVLADKFVAFRTAYFPNDAADYASAETWLRDALASNKGIPDAVAAQMMTDEKDRVLSEVSRASDAVLQSFAARRFPLPPGAAASAVLQIQQKGQDEVAAASRKITVASVDNLKWTVEKLLGLRQMAMGATLDYIKALVSAPQIASQLVGVGYDAQSKLISAASQFYGVRAEVAKITNQVNQYNVTTSLDAATKNQAADLTLIEDKLKALLMECQAFSQMATSLFNNLHANAGSSYNVSV